ncbi:50S ribosomal protein L25/general stress protein Ctc [Solitalea sp. MAHUQ-68]|uniref:Large ribosomal subunit protein bL25 n=1 Tax=Solitalea agri TaxID=2953739 RepID=A0A9X2F152_9SPHI|nr:50S ribosomal protein L25/general stress protein Ctc [Solitalea agri]MCO4292145.1 50S ribosomal protein L25/general stress protein Ctc [Solitalea agri]
MKSIAISGSKRSNVGKRDAKELRYEGLVPAVLYGGKEQTHFSVSAADLRPVLYTPDAMFIELTIDGAKHTAIVKDSQFHPLTDLVTHIDFLELFDDKPVVMELPIRLEGTSPGVRIGGKLNQKYRKLKVKGLPKDFVDYVPVDISKLELGKNIRVGEIKLENLEILNAKVDTMVSVLASRATRQADAEAAAATKGGKK